MNLIYRWLICISCFSLLHANHTDVVFNVKINDDGLQSKNALVQCFQHIFPDPTNLIIHLSKEGDISKAGWLSFDQMVELNDGVTSANISQITFVNTTSQYIMFSTNNGASVGGIECANGSCTFNFMGHFTFNLSEPSNRNINQIFIDESTSASGSNFELHTNSFPGANIYAKNTALFITADQGNLVELNSVNMDTNSKMVLFPASNLEIINGILDCPYFEIQGDSNGKPRIHSKAPLTIVPMNPQFYIDQAHAAVEDLISSDVQLTINGSCSFLPQSLGIQPNLTGTDLSISIQQNLFLYY